MIKFAFTFLFVLVVSFSARADVVLTLPKLTWAPYFMHDGGQLGHGYGVEVLDRCVARNGFSYRFIETSLNRSMHQLKEGALDFWVMSQRPGREDWLDYSGEPLFIDSYAMFVRQDFRGQIEQLSDLNGLRVGTMLGLKVSDDFQAYVAGLPKSLKPVEALDEKALLKRLEMGHIDVAVIGTAPFLATARRLNLSHQVKVVGKPLRQKPYYLVVSKKSSKLPDSRAFLVGFDLCLKALKQTPSFQKRYGQFLK